MESQADLVRELNSAVANATALYFRAHAAHWNVIGPGFAEYHELFEEIYEDVFGSIDTWAENLRKLGAVAPSSLSEIVSTSVIAGGAPLRDARSLCGDLIEKNKTVIDTLNDVFECSNAMNQQGIANFAAERIDMHQKWQWQLTASLGEDVKDAAADEIVGGVDVSEGRRRTLVTGVKSAYLQRMN